MEVKRSFSGRSSSGDPARAPVMAGAFRRWRSAVKRPRRSRRGLRTASRAARATAGRPSKDGFQLHVQLACRSKQWKGEAAERAAPAPLAEKPRGRHSEGAKEGWGISSRST